jgi:hypothetical protein
MKRSGLILLLILVQLYSSAQTVRGRVLDSLSRTALPMTTVAVLSPDSVFLRAVAADSLGQYSLPMPVDSAFIIKYSAAGHQDKYTGPLVLRDRSVLSVEDILLSPDRSQLGTVTVVGRRPVLETKNDGMIYNAAADNAIAGGTAADVMRRIPLLNVDQNGNLSIPGKSSIRIYIDNKPSEMYASSVADALRQISSEDIEKIEVITSPSARYEAEGADAVINITTKKNRHNGINGNVRGMARRYTRDMSAALKIRRNSMAYSVDMGIASYTFYWTENSWRNDENDQSPSSLYQHTDGKRKSWMTYSGLSATKIIDSLKTFSVGIRYRYGADDSRSGVFNSYESKSMASVYTRNIEAYNKNQGYSTNISYNAKSANKKNDLNLLSYFFSYQGTDNYDLDQIRNETTDHKEQSRGNIDNRELTVQADNTYKLNPQSTLEAGVKGVFRHFETVYDISLFDFQNENYLKDPRRSNGFEYNWQIYAGYFNYILSIKKWEIRIGLRYEQTRLHADFSDTALQLPDYKNLLPNILVSKKIGKYNSLRFSYRKNILRPYLSYLNPYINYIDSLNISFGNPYLVPSLQHGFQLVHSYSKGQVFWTNNFFMNHNRNTVENIKRIRPDGVSESSYQNAGRFMDMGLISSLALNRQTGLSFNLSCNLRYVFVRSEALNISNSGFTYGSSLSISYRFNKNFSVEGNANLFSRTVYLQGYETRWKGQYIAVNKKFFNEKLNLTVGISDFVSPYQKIKSRTRFQSLNQYEESRYLGRIYRIGLSYTFGKKDLAVPQTRTAEEN